VDPVILALVAAATYFFMKKQQEQRQPQSPPPQYGPPPPVPYGPPSMASAPPRVVRYTPPTIAPIPPVQSTSTATEGPSAFENFSTAVNRYASYLFPPAAVAAAASNYAASQLAPSHGAAGLHWPWREQPLSNCVREWAYESVDAEGRPTLVVGPPVRR
jgi:hypothetical protein